MSMIQTRERDRQQCSGCSKLLFPVYDISITFTIPTFIIQTTDLSHRQVEFRPLLNPRKKHVAKKNSNAEQEDIAEKRDRLTET